MVGDEEWDSLAHKGILKVEFTEQAHSHLASSDALWGQEEASNPSCCSYSRYLACHLPQSAWEAVPTAVWFCSPCFTQLCAGLPNKWLLAVLFVSVWFACNCCISNTFFSSEEFCICWQISLSVVTREWPFQNNKGLPHALLLQHGFIFSGLTPFTIS